MAANSPLHDASHVSPSVSSAKSVAPDRSGVRRMARAAQASGRSVRAQHGAATAAQSIDWNYVKTGSKASTPHANLGGMAASALGSAASASRVPLPLVAPAVKAVAQAAHRKPTSEAIVSDSTGDGSASLSEQPTEGAASGTSDGMSNGELQALATEIAERISRRTRRENERRGIWA